MRKLACDNPQFIDAIMPQDQYIMASDDFSLTVAENCVFSVGEAVFVTHETVLGAENLDTGSVFAMGKDYYLYICDADDSGIYKISLNSTFPHGYSHINTRKIGGFHVGKCRRVDRALNPVGTDNCPYGTEWESNVYDGIVPRSVWTLRHRPKCAPEGMVFLGHGTWVDLYLASDGGNGGLRSAFGATPLSGSEGYNWLSFNDRGLKNGKRLLSYDEFCRMAYGSPQGHDQDNISAWCMSANTSRSPTGSVANAVSAIGARDAVGNLWEWLRDIMVNPCPTVLMGTKHPAPYTFPSYDGGRSGKTIDNGSAHGPEMRSGKSQSSWSAGAWNYDRISPLGDTTGGNAQNGNVFQYYDASLTALLGGGGWSAASDAGCRAMCTSHYGLWRISAYFGARFACSSR